MWKDRIRQLKEQLNIGIEPLAGKLGVSENTVRGWLYKNRVPRNKDEVARLIDEILEHKEFFIEKSYFDDCGRECPPSDDAFSMYSVIANNKHGKFYMGGILDSYRLTHLSNFMNSNIMKEEGVANVAKDQDLGRWVGWSHRAICSFGIGEMIFEDEYGDDRTTFNMHGKHPIKTEADMIESASRFARYVS